MFGLSAIIGAMEGYKARKEWLDTLTQEVRDKILAADKLEYEKNLKHKRALELAEASRPRNFWGR